MYQTLQSAFEQFSSWTIMKTNLNCDTFLCNVPIDMYGNGKCGSVDSSEKVCKEMAYRNVITWIVLITALGLNGHAHEALQRFQNNGIDGVET